jgi:hypothetical protein
MTSHRLSLEQSIAPSRHRTIIGMTHYLLFMSLDLAERINRIIRDSSKAVKVEDEFTSDLLQKFERMAHELETRIPKSIDSIKTISDIVITLGGVFIGFVTGNKTVSGAAAWILVLVFLFFAGFLGIVSRHFPDDTIILKSMIKRIRLGTLVERLAAQLAVFDGLSKISYSDAEETIEKISSFVDELNDPKNVKLVEVLQQCLDKKRDIQDSRETNAKVSLNLPVKKQSEIHEGISQVAYLAEKLFPGKTFSAKLYLRARKKFKDNIDVEILVSFARYASGKDNTHLGTSWIKARSNPSYVWKSLEAGRAEIGSDGSYNSYYDSILAVCLPNRVGVLALTSNHIDAFSEVKKDATVIKTLQLCGIELVRRILDS